jgi:hypothetical protein
MEAPLYFSVPDLNTVGRLACKKCRQDKVELASVAVQNTPLNLKLSNKPLLELPERVPPPRAEKPLSLVTLTSVELQ